MENNKVKWGDKEVYLHHLSSEREYVLVSYSLEKSKLFKVNVEELDLKGKKLDAYLLGKVEKRSL